MIETALNPALVEYAAKRYLQQAVLEVRECAALGVETIWLEECLTDIISPETFSRINIPIMTALVDEIRSLGMKSIYYYTGNPTDRFKHILSVGADAIALEEGKKGFTIDIEEVVDSVNGRCTVLGNLDAIGILEQGSEDELRAEITRQINAGRRNGGRFIMSIGSPATPGTSLERLCLYREMSHEIGASQ
jgi:uroporphyrinogen-III decarboxylase